ncbi:LacI family DNA-binding transcriptional regulator [Clostridium sp. CCUG 7971]|uniref:LacI family DNA-binding transcriptional regulator n=1 Tax=Clostridium sp. CCUG 7971 TaxID=2811414 RepID=UPI001ABB1167|nr:LacI family DNA-binding transcriptional regulator [Clostridium sp. CCUG 7971]MBO3444211.1 LacI family DNA-binding transcriptional regulator [Clostridium sp. CCUG 7971]
MNIIDIAKLSGVSKSTVSRFLNDGYVSEENRSKIQKVIDETGFIPSSYAKTLRTKKTNLIGVILPKISSETIGKIVSGISEETSNSGYNIILGNTDLNIEKEIEYLQIFKNKNVDGVILVATIVTQKHLDIIKDMKIPIVIVGQKIDGYPCVYHSDYEASYDMTKYLIQKGHKKISYIGVTKDDISAGLNRELGYKDCLKSNKLKINESLIKIGEFSQESGYKNAKELIEKNKDIDAIFCATYNIALGAIEYLKEVNINIPNDVSVCAIGDSKISNIISPRLTTMHYYYENSGIESARMILKMIDSKNGVNSIKLGYKLKSRESVKI